MSLNSTPSSERTHIGFFGCRNAGKSSLVNRVTNQALSVVSDIKGTTTDPVTKAMELLPIGPVVIIDTPGFDDSGKLGDLRIQKTRDILAKTDIAVLVVDATAGLSACDTELIRIFEEQRIPYITVFNKCDLLGESFAATSATGPASSNSICVSALADINIYELKELIGKTVPARKSISITQGLIDQGDTVILVCPIDESAPRGRLILPQQQTIRAILDSGAMAYVTREFELERTLQSLRCPPKLIITDSQALSYVSPLIPENINLTTFSILMARYKGFLSTATAGIASAKNLKSGDKILMAEGCTHHRQCNDIGTVKIPKLLQKYCGCNLIFETCTGTEFPQDLSPYKLVIHCGACMNTDRDVQNRMSSAVAQGVPFTNYGITLAMVTGTLERTLRCFPDIHKLIE